MRGGGARRQAGERHARNAESQSSPGTATVLRGQMTINDEIPRSIVFYHHLSSFIVIWRWSWPSVLVIWTASTRHLSSSTSPAGVPEFSVAPAKAGPIHPPGTQSRSKPGRGRNESPRSRRAVQGKCPKLNLVAPAKAGAHRGPPENGPRSQTHAAGQMGPRFRGDDKRILSLAGKPGAENATFKRLRRTSGRISRTAVRCRGGDNFGPVFPGQACRSAGRGAGDVYASPSLAA
jgi:hypothetical protein